jgi:predicted metal-binding protein
MVSGTPNVKQLPTDRVANQQVIQEAVDLGSVKVKVIPVRDITLGHWVRLRCQFGCSHFNQRFTCPTFSPTCDEMGDILMGYRRALVVEAPQSRDVHRIILSLENRLKGKGFFKAFGLQALPCDLCDECTINSQCKYPDKARPTMQACGIDVSQTLMNIGWDFAVQFQPCTEDHNIGMVLLD